MFSDHVGLLSHFLDRRPEIVENIEGRLLNVRGKDTSRSRDRAYFERILDGCFLDLPGLPRELLRLSGQLAARHVADGFEPVLRDRYAHELDALELVLRAYAHWESHRWPGKSGRLTYAAAMYSVVILRQLEHLSLRIWDDGNERAEDHLHEVQRLLDRLNASTAPNAFVRDARWLIQTAQGPLTLHLQPYFTIAERVAASLTTVTALGLHKAGARLAGGHLRSQLRYRMWSTDRPIDDVENLAAMRNSNSMDGALLIHDLVPLLNAYEAACVAEDVEGRLELADAILQGLSADPELLLTRLDLLAPCTMIEDLFVERGSDGRARYTRMGHAHLDLVAAYADLICRLAGCLRDDASHLHPAQRVYSPLGIAYGFCADILSNMALAALVAQSSNGLSLEDVFISRGRLQDKLTRAADWKALPKREGEREHFDHSSEFAIQIFERMTHALDARVLHGAVANASRYPRARLFVVSSTDSVESLPAGALPAGVVRADEHCLTSDLARALSGVSIACSRAEMLSDRNEGRFLASVESDGAWIGISKVILTVLIGQGQDAFITDVPPPAIDVLRLTCPGLIVS